MAAFVFYLFATFLVTSGLMVVLSRNPVHGVLFLILSFFNAAALFLFLQAEFLSMILVIVYVGAVAVLFLFVVMMLDVRPNTMKSLFLFSSLKSWMKSLAAAFSYCVVCLVGIILLTYTLSVLLSYTAVYLSLSLESLGFDFVGQNPVSAFIAKLQSLPDSSNFAVFLNQEGILRPRASNLLYADINIESIVSLLIVAVSVMIAHIFSNSIIQRLFNMRFEGLLLSPPVLILVSLGLCVLLGYGVLTWTSSPLAQNLILEPMSTKAGVSNTKALGMILYTHYGLVFQMAGVLLLIAMIGAIVLTLRRRDGVKRQDVRVQISRSKENSLEVCRVPIGKGVKL
ncbi:MAG: NADH-quinone oxidoreductase subunit J [Alphaproteobacteria bacterium]|nr:NADH-quinone oxidoreductase subunit J [Alphaproteobacteria bacterium]